MTNMRTWINTIMLVEDTASDYALTDTSEFRAWFAGSRIIDRQGAPLVVWHGLKSPLAHIDKLHKRVLFSPNFSRFDTAKRIEPGAWFSPQIDVVRHYGTPAPFFLRAVNPLRTEDPISERPAGHDAVFRMRSTRMDIWDAWEIAVFHPDQIRLAFDINDPTLVALRRGDDAG